MKNRRLDRIASWINALSLVRRLILEVTAFLLAMGSLIALIASWVV